MKAISLTVVSGGVGYGFAPDHVDHRIVDLDNLCSGDKVCLPAGIGFEELAEQAGISEHVEFVKET